MYAGEMFDKMQASIYFGVGKGSFLIELLDDIEEGGGRKFCVFLFWKFKI